LALIAITMMVQYRGEMLDTGQEPELVIVLGSSVETPTGK
jgi:hypothetical protein